MSEKLNGGLYYIQCNPYVTWSTHKTTDFPRQVSLY